MPANLGLYVFTRDIVKQTNGLFFRPNLNTTDIMHARKLNDQRNNVDYWT